MRVAYSRRAIRDIEAAAAYSRKEFGDRVALAFEARLRSIIDQIRNAPESGARVRERPGVHVLRVGHYPYRVFYRLSGDGALILHLRHTSRQIWAG